MPQLPPWTLLSPEVPLDVVAGRTLLVSPIQPRTDEVRVLEVTLPSSLAKIRHAILGSTDAPRTTEVPQKRRVNEFCAEFFGQRVDHVLVVPPARWSQRPGLFSARTPTTIGYEDDPRSGYEPRHLVARIASLPAPEGAPPRAHTGAASGAAQARVDGVKQERAELAGDIAYRIENSALFDPSAPLTRQLELLLLRWDDESARLSSEATDDLAMEIRLAFDTARQHAEAVGLTHLPATARPDAGRALKAAHLAREATTEGEREAAMTQVIRILDSIALYYLPATDDVPAMLGGARPQLGST